MKTFFRSIVRAAAVAAALTLSFGIEASAEVILDTGRTKITTGDKYKMVITRDDEVIFDGQGEVKQASFYNDYDPSRLVVGFGDIKKTGTDWYLIRALLTGEKFLYDQDNDKLYIVHESYAKVGTTSDDIPPRDVDLNSDSTIDIKYADGKWTVSDVKGAFTFTVDGQEGECPIRSYKNGVFRYKGSNGKFGLVNTKGEIVLPCEYDKISPVGDQIITAYKGSSMLVYSAALAKITAPLGRYVSIGKRTLRDEAYWVEAPNNKWGAIATDGREIVAPLYGADNLRVGNTVGTYRDEYTFHIKNKAGFIKVVTFEGKTIIPFGKYTDVEGYDRNGYIIVKNGKKVGAVDSNGKVIVPAKYARYEFMGQNFNLVFSNENRSGGGTLYIYSPKGALVASRTFNNNPYSVAVWLKNMLGGGYLEPLYRM